MSELAAAEGVGAIVDMQHHPFGNSYFPTTACGGAPYDADIRHCLEKRCTGMATPPSDCFAANVSDIVVQHGPQEAIFNRAQACAKDITTEKGEAWYTRYWSFTACIEDHYSEGIGCARECGVSANFTRDEMSYLRSCIGTPAGDKSVIREAKAMKRIDHSCTIRLHDSTFDMDKEVAAATRRQVFDMVAAEKIPFLGYHMPFPSVGYVEKTDQGYMFMPKTYQFAL